jgi:hypothetical protein
MTLNTILNIVESLKENKNNHSFSMKTLASFTSNTPDEFGERLRYAHYTLKFLGQGSSRAVFKYKNVAIKIATSEKGVAQNALEAQMTGYEGDVIAHILDYDKQFKFLITELALETSPSASKMEAITGLDDIHLALDYLVKWGESYDYFDGDVNKVNKHMSKVGWNDDNIINNDWIKSVLNLVVKYGLISWDIIDENLGIVMRDGIYHLVIIDAGYNNQISYQYYNAKSFGIPTTPTKKYKTH